MSHSADLQKASSAFNFLPMNDFLVVNNVICNLIGLPLNLLTAFYIVFKPRLHQTRNILWLGVASSNVLVLSDRLVESYAYQFNCETAKKISSLLAGLPHPSLALNLFLWLVDRYIRVAHSAWYKRNVTISWIVSGQIGCFSILCVVIKSPYLFELIPLPSQLITVSEVKIISIIGTLFVLACLFGQVLVYSKAKCYLRLMKDVDLDVSPSTNRRAYNRQARIVETTEFMEGEPAQRNSSPDDVHTQHNTTALIQNQSVTLSPFFIQVGDQAISRAELEATSIALDCVSLFLVFTLPVFVTFMFIAIYGFLLPAPFAIAQDLSTYFLVLTYTRGLMLIYPVINPILFTRRSRNFSQAL